MPADGLLPVQVTFSEPGTYVLRCRADDGALVADEEVTIVVVRSRARDARLRDSRLGRPSLSRTVAVARQVCENQPAEPACRLN